ncbi:hypothetical protein GGI20_004153 [Coemansia sp. BCRC 34301]|nr:hypothetical protein GGI20_004153 [Coemansia sp. BCRC 34301]
MRLYIVLALTSFLVAVASADSKTSDFVTLTNKAYIKKYKKDYKMYEDNEAGKCINVDKIFDDKSTEVVLIGRSVKLYAGADCKEKFRTTKTSPSTPVVVKHAILSFKILYHAAATPATTLQLWKKKLPLLSVCRSWTKLAQPFVLDHVFIEVFEACDAGEFEDRAPSNDEYLGWRSNAELLILRHCFLLARQLTIEMASGTTLNHLERIALGILKLDRVDWMNINTLIVVGNSLDCEYYVDESAADDFLPAKVARTMEYFGRNMRNVVELNLADPFIGIIGDLACGNFASTYSGQLQVLRSQGPIPLHVSNFSRNLVVLELTLDSEATCVLPGVCGEALKVLKLADVPHNFAWHHFRYDIFARPIVFPRLSILHLLYKQEYAEPTEDEVQGKVTLGALNCDQLQFPTLKELRIHNCTPDCDLLYADTPFPELEKVRLTVTIKSLFNCKRLKLGWVGDLNVEIDTFENGATTGIHDVTNHLFTNICIGRTATLTIYSRQITINPELVLWANLTSLQVAKVSFETLCKLIARLPNLCNLLAQGLEFGPVLADRFAIDESLFRSTDPMLAWGERLDTVIVSELDDECVEEVGAYGIQAIVLRLGALKKLSVPELVKPLVTAFIKMNKGRFLHLARVDTSYV